jgi:hypothetical protein
MKKTLVAKIANLEKYLIVFLFYVWAGAASNAQSAVLSWIFNPYDNNPYSFAGSEINFKKDAALFEDSISAAPALLISNGTLLHAGALWFGRNSAVNVTVHESGDMKNWDFWSDVYVNGVIPTVNGTVLTEDATRASGGTWPINQLFAKGNSVAIHTVSFITWWKYDIYLSATSFKLYYDCGPSLVISQPVSYSSFAWGGIPQRVAYSATAPSADYYNQTTYVTLKSSVVKYAGGYIDGDYFPQSIYTSVSIPNPTRAYNGSFMINHNGIYSLTITDYINELKQLPITVNDDTAPTTPGISSSFPALNSQIGIKPPLMQVVSTEIAGDTGVKKFYYTMIKDGSGHVVGPIPGVIDRAEKFSVGDGTFLYKSVQKDIGKRPTGDDIPSGIYDINIWASDYVKYDPNQEDIDYGNRSEPLLIHQKILNGPPRISWPKYSSSTESWYNADSIPVNAEDDLGGLIPSEPRGFSSLQFSASTSSFPATLTWMGTDVPVVNGVAAIPVTEGVNNFYIGAMDQAGNCIISDLCTYNIDRTLPVINVRINGTSIDVGTSGKQYVNDTTASTIVCSDPLPVGIDVCSGIKAGTFQYTRISPAPTNNADGWDAVGNDFSFTSQDAIGESTYTFKVYDNAGNWTTLTFPVVYNPIPIYLAQSDGTWDNIFFRQSTGSFANLDSSVPVATDVLKLSFPNVGTAELPQYGGADDRGYKSYAPPASISLWLKNKDTDVATPSKTFSFAAEAGIYSTTINLSEFGILPDGDYLCYYRLADPAGLAREDSFEISLHNTPPSGISQDGLSRYSPTGSDGANTWAQVSLPLTAGASASKVFSTSYVNIGGITDSASGLDGIGFDYSDLNAPKKADTSVLFPLSGYAFSVVDAALNLEIQSAPSGSQSGLPGLYREGTSLHYLFRWKNEESSRSLVLKVTDEAGVTASTTISVEKPVLPGFADGSPAKESGGQSFRVVWSDGTAAANWTKGLRWDLESPGTETLFARYAASSGGRAVIEKAPDTIKVGDTIAYKPVITNSSGFAPVEVQGASSKAYIGYEPLAIPTLPTSVYIGAGSASALRLEALATTVADGTNLRYALRLVVGSVAAYYPYSAQAGGFVYDLWSLLGVTKGSDQAESLKRLAAAMNGATLSASVVAWYGQSLDSPSPTMPSVAVGAFYNGGTLGEPPIAPLALTSAWALSNVACDIAPPLVKMEGDLARPDIQTNSIIVAGTATDTGGSSLDYAQVQWAKLARDANGAWIVDGSYSAPLRIGIGLEGDFSYNLALGQDLQDGMYSIQVVAIDKAGNQSANSAIQKLLDTRAPEVTQFRVGAGQVGSVLADAGGGIVASLTIDEGCGSGMLGSGLGAVYYQWQDSQGNASSTGWAAATICPAVYATFNGTHATPESYTLTFGDAPSGTSYLHYKVADKAGNLSGDFAATQAVSYQGKAPAASIEISGWRESGGQFWIKGASDLTVGFAPAVGEAENPIAEARWNVQLVKADGGQEDDSGSWSAWGATFEVVRGIISRNAQAYRIRLQVRNANGVTGQALSSPVFTQDGRGPEGIAATLSAAVVVAGQSIRTTVSGSDPFGPLSWTWTYKANGGGAVTQEYVPGSDIVIASPGSYAVMFTATSGSGLSASSSEQQLTVNGSGLAVADNQRYVAQGGTASGRWSYMGASPTSFSYRWIRAGDDAVLQDWTAGNATKSCVLSLGSAGLSLAQGDVVQLEVEARDAQGELLDREKSPGATVDTTAPAVGLSAAPSFVAPNDLWLRFTAGDPESGVKGGTVYVKKLSVDAQGKVAWTAVAHRSIPASNGQRLDLDLSSAEGLVTGDRVIADLSIENGAGLTSTVETGVMLVDATAPPEPIVLPVAAAADGTQVLIPNAVNPVQRIGLDFSFTAPDAVSGTAKYLWKAYSSGQDPATIEWALVPSGQTKVTGLDYSGTADGTLLYFSVMAVDGAGLTSVGTSRGVVLDSLAPEINDLSLIYPSGSGYASIGAFARLSDLADAGGVHGVFTAVDRIVDLASFRIQAGTYTDSTGFAGIGTPIDFPSPEVRETTQRSPLVPLVPSIGRLYAGQGRAFNAAGNATSYTSAAFQAVGSPPGVAALAGNLAPNTLSFTWTIDRSDLPADFAGYSISMRKGDGASLLKDGSGTAVSTLTVSVPVYTVEDWKALGLVKGDSVTFTVTPQTQLGIGQSKSVTIAIQPDAPLLEKLEYTRYFSARFNVKQVAYKVDSGVEQIQIRVRDGTTGQLVQDWISDYTGNAMSLTTPYPEADGIRDGQRLFLEVRAESQCGIWSAPATSEVILVDETPADSVAINRPAGARGAVSAAYSNAMGNTGAIEGWSAGGKDDQSGIIAYQAILLSAARYDELMRSPKGLAGIAWDQGSAPVPSSASPGVSWRALDIVIGGAESQSDYYAVLRVQNGTEEWSAPSLSSVVHVSWAVPELRLLLDSSVFARRDSTGCAVTNDASELLTFSSSEENTECVLSVNGTVFGAVTTGGVGAEGLSRGTIALAGPGTDALSVTGTDLYGNKATVQDSLRFNLPTSIDVASEAGETKVYTTPGKPFVAEQALAVTDDFRDYPLSYSLDIGPGTLVSLEGTATAQSGANGSEESPWLPGGKTTIKYYQSAPKAQVSEYTLIVKVTDSWGLVTTRPIPIEVDNTVSGPLYTSEYWTGPIVLSGIVEVPSGLSLTLDSVQGEIFGSLSTEGIMQGGILIDSGGRMIVSNGGGASKFDTYIEGFRWKGIQVSGEASGTGLELDRSERAFALMPGGKLTMGSLSLGANLIGIHLLGGILNVDGGAIVGNSEYGIKEDVAGDFVVRGMTFSGNGVDYYRAGTTGITIQELNALTGNGGNR